MGFINKLYPFLIQHAHGQVICFPYFSEMLLSYDRRLTGRLSTIYISHYLAQVTMLPHMPWSLQTPRELFFFFKGIFKHCKYTRFLYL